MRLIQQDGHIPSVAEVAVRSKVSRATAYRYFPSRSALVTAVIDTLARAGAQLRVRQGRRPRSACTSCSLQTFPRFKEFEPQLRAAAQLTLEQWALERAGLLEEEPYRRGHRVRILEHAIAAAGAAACRPKVRERLHHALSVVYGIEPYVVLKDIWGAARPRGRAHRAVDGRRADRRGAARSGAARIAPREHSHRRQRACTAENSLVDVGKHMSRGAAPQANTERAERMDSL